MFTGLLYYVRMYAKHFIGMLIGLIVMALIGLGFLVMTNHYSNRDPLAGITPSVSNTKTVSTSTNALKSSTAKALK